MTISKICPVEELKPKKVQVVFIGGSTGGTFEEIRMAAEALKGKNIAYIIGGVSWDIH